MKLSLLIAALFITASCASQNARELSSKTDPRGEVVSRMNFQVTVNTNSITCVDGVEGDYATPLELYIRGLRSGGLTFPSKLILNNTDTIRYRGTPEQKCKDFKAYTQGVNAIKVEGRKNIFRSTGFNSVSRTCQETLREEFFLNIKGREFSGVQEFKINPVDEADCK